MALSLRAQGSIDHLQFMGIVTWCALRAKDLEFRVSNRVCEEIDPVKDRVTRLDVVDLINFDFTRWKNSGLFFASVYS